jgi:hypothetical protein
MKTKYILKMGSKFISTNCNALFSEDRVKSSDFPGIDSMGGMDIGWAGVTVMRRLVRVSWLEWIWLA